MGATPPSRGFPVAPRLRGWRNAGRREGRHEDRRRRLSDRLAQSLERLCGQAPRLGAHRRRAGGGAPRLPRVRCPRAREPGGRGQCARSGACARRGQCAYQGRGRAAREPRPRVRGPYLRCVRPGAAERGPRAGQPCAPLRAGRQLRSAGQDDPHPLRARGVAPRFRRRYCASSRQPWAGSASLSAATARSRCSAAPWWRRAPTSFWCPPRPRACATTGGCGSGRWRGRSRTSASWRTRLRSVPPTGCPSRRRTTAPPASMARPTTAFPRTASSRRASRTWRDGCMARYRSTHCARGAPTARCRPSATGPSSPSAPPSWRQSLWAGAAAS